MGQVLFNIVIGDVVSGIGCTHRKFADSSRLCGADNVLEERDAIHRDFDKLERRRTWEHSFTRSST